MRKYTLLLSSLILLQLSLFSQPGSPALKPRVFKPVYFDVSPPLKDLVKELPATEDLSWKDGVVMNYFNPAYGGSGGQTDGIVVDPVLQNSNGLLPGDTTVRNFDGLWNVSGYVPPDTHGEAGPNHYFQVVNCSYAIFNKAGARIFGPWPNSSIWNGLPNNENSGDAVVHYDENANRWMFTQFSLPYSNGPWYQMVAVSVTADPTGPWYRWEYEFDAMPDYPKFGVWPDAYYMSSNNFAPGAGWVGNSACAFDRTAMLAGDPDALRIQFDLSPGSAGFITLYPSDCDGTFPASSTPNYFTYIKTGGTQVLGIYEFHADFANPPASTFGNLLSLPVAPFSNLQQGIPQLGTDKKLETLADRLMYRLQYRKFGTHESMVVNHTVNAGSNVAGIRWYELRRTGGAWAIYQQSTYAPDNHSRWMGSIAMDTAGSIALGYSVSSSSIYPAIRYTGRLEGDPLNQMTIAEGSVIEGGGCQTGSWSGRSRWGDYSGMSVDPSNPTTFWFTTEYYATTSISSWVTRIASFTFDNIFSSGASATPGNLCLGDSSQLQALPYGGSGNYTYSWSSLPAGFSSTQPDPVVAPSDTTWYILTTSDGTTSRSDTTRVNVNYPPFAFAGNDTTVCSWASEVPLQGTASHYKSVAWGSTGDGTFSSRYTLNTLYYPGPEDIAAGGTDVRLLVYAQPPCSGKVISSRHLTIDPCTGIDPMNTGLPGMKLYPNPASGTVTLSVAGLSGTEGRLMIQTPDGRTIRNQTIGNLKPIFELQIRLNDLTPGIYLVTLVCGEQRFKEKLVVE